MSRRAKPKELLVAESDAMQRVVSAVENYASEDVPVLIEGEPGTVRELIARILHKASQRRSKPFVSVSAGAALREIFNSEIEGSSMAAFHRAEGGTMLVKNLPELSRASQRKLNRSLSPVRRRKGRNRGDDEFDVRVVATTDPDLESAVGADVFNKVLYERISKHSIVVPPLRERIPDIAPLAAQLVRTYAREIGRSRMTISTRAFDRLVTYPWPGNVAELKSITRRLVVRAKKSQIDASQVDAILPQVAERVPLEDMSFEDMVRTKLGSFLRRVDGHAITGFHDDVIARVERPLLDLVMEHTGGNQVKAAEILGLNRNTLRRKLAEHGIARKATTRAAAQKSKKSS
jgi:two-component system nitrogen regulation response regulator GlnG